MKTFIQKLYYALTAIAVIATPISALAGNSGFLQLLTKYNPNLGSILLCITASFFLYSAASNWDWAFSSFVSRLAEKVVGRSGMRVLFVLFAIYCGQIGVNGFTPYTLVGETQQTLRCGEMRTNSFIDRDGECDCLIGYAWNNDSNPTDFHCVSSVDG
jgi:hypothetical protein